MKTLARLTAVLLALCVWANNAFALTLRPADLSGVPQDVQDGLCALADMVASACYLREVYALQADESPEPALTEGLLLRAARLGWFDPTTDKNTCAANDAQVREALDALLSAPERCALPQQPECPCITRGEDEWVFDVSLSGGSAGACLYAAKQTGENAYTLLADVFESDSDDTHQTIAFQNDDIARWVGTIEMNVVAQPRSPFGFALSSYLFTPHAQGLTLSVREETLQYFAPKAARDDAPRYVFHYSYPYAEDGADAYTLACINEYFEMAVSEMNELVLPMFAAELREGGTTTLNHTYEVACNNGRYLGVMTLRSSEQDGAMKRSVASQVIDVSGEYAGETLTLRGVVMLGESSDELSEMFLEDVYARLCDLTGTDVDYEEYAAEFYPAQDFCVNEAGELFFYLQPGRWTSETEYVRIPYTRDECEALYQSWSLNAAL